MSNAIKTTILLAALTGLFIVVGGALGGRGGMVIAFLFAIIMNLGAYWFSGDIALRMAGAQEVSPEQAPDLHRLVEELATYARLPKPRVAIIARPSPSACPACVRCSSVCWPSKSPDRSFAGGRACWSCVVVCGRTGMIRAEL